MNKAEKIETSNELHELAVNGTIDWDIWKGLMEVLKHANGVHLVYCYLCGFANAYDSIFKRGDIQHEVEKSECRIEWTRFELKANPFGKSEAKLLGIGET